MTSQRHTPDGILDAARDSVLAVGVRRTTLTEVARRAGVSRMTLYRRYPDVTSLVTDLMSREFVRILATEERRHVEPRGARYELVAHVIAAVRALRASPLLAKVLDVDPELLLPYVIDRLGETQRHGEEFFATYVRSGHTDGTVRLGDVATQARTLLLVAQSYVLSIGPASEGVDTDALYAELRVLLDSYLAPS